MALCLLFLRKTRYFLTDLGGGVRFRRGEEERGRRGEEEKDFGFGIVNCEFKEGRRGEEEMRRGTDQRALSLIIFLLLDKGELGV